MTKEEAIAKWDEMSIIYNNKSVVITLWKDYFRKSYNYPDWLKEDIKALKKMRKYLDELLTIYYHG